MVKTLVGAEELPGTPVRSCSVNNRAKLEEKYLY